MSHANLSRRAIMSSAAALPALAMPALASAASDPIFAAIEKHRRACAYTQETFGRPCADDDPLLAEVYGAQDAAAMDLLDIQPTTVAGAAALLNYYVEVETTNEEVFPQLLDEDGNAIELGEADPDSCPPYGRFVARNAARALVKLAVRS